MKLGLTEEEACEEVKRQLGFTSQRAKSTKEHEEEKSDVEVDHRHRAWRQRKVGRLVPNHLVPIAKHSHQ